MMYKITNIGGIDYLYLIDEGYNVIKPICSLKGAMIILSNEPKWEIYNQGICVLTFDANQDLLFEINGDEVSEVNNYLERLSQSF